MEVSPQRREWAESCDPFELVRVAREGVTEIGAEGSLHRLDEPKREMIVASLDQLTERFEQQARAALGSSVPAGTTP